MSTSHKSPLDAPLASQLRRALAKLVEESGERKVAERLRTDRKTVARCLAGLPVRAGTRALVELALQELARAGAA